MDYKKDKNSEKMTLVQAIELNNKNLENVIKEFQELSIKQDALNTKQDELIALIGEIPKE